MALDQSSSFDMKRLFRRVPAEQNELSFFYSGDLRTAGSPKQFLERALKMSLALW